jgi:hypothetical protein
MWKDLKEEYFKFHIWNVKSWFFRLLLIKFLSLKKYYAHIHHKEKQVLPTVETTHLSLSLFKSDENLYINDWMTKIVLIISTIITENLFTDISNSYCAC